MNPPNMLSQILAQPYSNEVSFPDLEHRVPGELVVGSDLLSVDADSATVDQAASLVAALGQLRLDEDVDDVSGLRKMLLLNRDRQVALPKFAVEVSLGAHGGLLTVKALDELPRERRLGIARFHCEDAGLLLLIKT